MTTNLKDNTGQGVTQAQAQTGLGTGSGMVLPTDVGLRAQALEYAIKHINNPQDALKAAEIYYNFLREGLDQTLSSVTNGQQANKYQAGQAGHSR